MLSVSTTGRCVSFMMGEAGKTVIYELGIDVCLSFYVGVQFGRNQTGNDGPLPRRVLMLLSTGQTRSSWCWRNTL